jgi:glutaminase
VNEAYTKFKSATSGKNADYIPYLAKVDFNLFGVAVVTADNQSYTLGDVGYQRPVSLVGRSLRLIHLVPECLRA